VLGSFGQMQNKVIFGMSILYILFGAGHLSSRHDSSDAEISRIF
jgi:hypothetical protein